jgi:two-component system sensor histidine kinase DegS
MRHAIQATLDAIAESRQRVEEIARSTMDEVRRLEAEYEQVRNECNQAIARVEELEREARVARERLMIVNRDVNKYTERDMQAAYEAAQQVQIELGQWRERELQLRFRRDDIGRRLKALRATAAQAEIVLAKFNHTAQYLSTEFGEIAAVLEQAHVQNILGLQMLQLQEEERRWLAAQLHDGPMQALASIGMRLQSPSPEAAKDVRQRLNAVIAELRQIVFDLRPPLLDDLGLVPTLKRYLQQWSETHALNVRIQLIGIECALSPTEKVTLFRGVQEAVKNAAKHSQADKVEVTLIYGIDELHIHIADNGIGIAEVAWMDWLEQGKLGLTLCRQRMSALGGSMRLEPNEPRGTKVILTLPIQRGVGKDG